MDQRAQDFGATAAGAQNPASPDGRHLGDDQAFLSTIQRELDASQSWTGSRLARARRQNMQEYFGNLRGDEREGRSQVICRDTFEQVEMLLPPLMEIFTSGSEIVRFSPQGAEDAEGAEQASAAVNHVFRTQQGFMVLYTMFKDALIQKNGIVKVFWDEDADPKIEQYEGKTFSDLQALMQAQDVEIRAITAWVQGPGHQRVEVSNEQAEQLLQQNPYGVFFDIEIMRINQGKVGMENVPPEEFFINRDARSLHHRSCRFVDHKVLMSVSELIELGIDPETARRLPPAHNTQNTDMDFLIRSSQDDATPFMTTRRTDGERTAYVHDCYIRADRDGDGISEWHRALVGGNYGEVLLASERVDGHPFCSVTPIPVPHRFHGLALADITTDIQNINTTLWRQFLNSGYMMEDPSWIVYSQGWGDAAVPQVNLDQLVSNTPGSYVEEYQPNALRPLERTSNAKDIIPAFEVHAQMKERRTGLSPESMGVDSQQISKHVFGAMVQTSAAAQRVGLYARIFAETGVRDMARLIYKEFLKHPTAQTIIRLRGEYVPIDPSSWKDNWDCQITVGLGHGSRMEKVANLQAIGAMQQTIGSAFPGMVGPEQAFNTFNETVEAMGFKDGTKFVLDPNAVQLPEPPPDPAVVALEYQREIELMKVELDRQKVEVERYKAQIDTKVKELEHEVEVKKLELEGKKVQMDEKFNLEKAAATKNGDGK